MAKTTLVNYAIPFISSSGAISSNTTNLYCQAGVDNIQTVFLLYQMVMVIPYSYSCF